MTKNLTTGGPMRLILGFTLPMLFGMLFQQMYNMVDTMIVGKLLGAQALAAVGATGSINFLVIGFCTGMCGGFAIPVAQQMGAENHSRMRRYVANAAYLSAVFAVAMTVATGLLCGRILTAMDTPADIYRDSYNYIFMIFMGIPATYLYNLLSGIIRSLGDSKTPVYFLALSSILNIGLDFAFILGGDMGVAGAAIATVVSQGVSGLACLVYMCSRFSILRMSQEECKPDAAISRDLLAIGMPMGLQYSITAIGSIILQSAVNGLGSLYVAAVAAGGKLFQLLVCPYDAMGSAMATYCGQNAGAGKLERLNKGILDCSLLGLIYTAVAIAVMMVFAPSCAMWFIDPGEGEMTLLVDLVSQYIRTLTVFFFPLALVNIVRFSIQGMGFSTFAITAGVLEMAARSVVGGFFVPLFGFRAVCFASPAAWVCADLFLIPACVFCINRLRQHQLMPDGQPESLRRHHIPHLPKPRLGHLHA